MGRWLPSRRDSRRSPARGRNRHACLAGRQWPRAVGTAAPRGATLRRTDPRAGTAFAGRNRGDCGNLFVALVWSHALAKSRAETARSDGWGARSEPKRWAWWNRQPSLPPCNLQNWRVQHLSCLWMDVERASLSAAPPAHRLALGRATPAFMHAQHSDLNLYGKSQPRFMKTYS